MKFAYREHGPVVDVDDFYDNLNLWMATVFKHQPLQHLKLVVNILYDRPKCVFYFDNLLSLTTKFISMPVFDNCIGFPELRSLLIREVSFGY